MRRCPPWRRCSRSARSMKGAQGVSLMMARLAPRGSMPASSSSMQLSCPNSGSSINGRMNEIGRHDLDADIIARDECPLLPGRSSHGSAMSEMIACEGKFDHRSRNRPHCGNSSR